MSNVGLLGLTGGVNDRAAARQDLATLETVANDVQKDRDREVLAQQQIAMEQEAFFNQSSQLLEKDRNRINKRFMMHQNMISDKIKNYGGDRSKFMEAGGLGQIKGIKNQMLNSEEMVRYQSNQKNLAKILEAKAKGLGHLLSPNDIKSAENYDKSDDGGQITYAGMMSDIEIPSSANFDYGTEIPLANILSFKANAMKVKNNYKMVYPDRPEPNAVELASFAKKMGYGGQGSNTEKMKLLAKEKEKRAKYEKEKKDSQKGSGKKDADTRNFLTEVVAVHSQLDKNITVKNFQGEGAGGKYMEGVLNNQPHMRNTVKNQNRINGIVRNLDEKGFDFHTISSVGNDRMGLSNSHEILANNSGDIAKIAFNNFEVKDGKILNFEPDEKMYSANGSRMVGKHALEWDEYNGDYTIKGVFTGFKGNTSDKDVPSLVMDAYDNDGNIHDERSAEIQDNFGGSNLTPSTFVAVEDEDGNIFYKEIDLADQQTRQTYDIGLGSNDDLTSQVKNEKGAAKRIANAHKLTDDQTLVFNEAFKTYDEKVFNNTLFHDEGEKYFGAGGGASLNRYPLMKSFYMTSDYFNNQKKGDANTYASSTGKLIDMNLFSMTAEVGGITDILSDYKNNLNDEDIAMKLLEGLNKGEEKGSVKYQNNEQFISKLIQIHKLQQNR